MDKTTKVENIISQYEKQFREFFTSLNNLPEPSLKEFKTTEYLVEQLKKLNIQYQRLTEKTGLFGELNFNKPKTVTLRADIDALPIGDGKFAHRCGHSTHSSALLTVLAIIKQEKIELPFNLRFVFQHAEETGDGALVSLEKNAYANSDLVFAVHSFNNPKNQVIVTHGKMLSGVGYGHIKVFGPGGHSSKSNEIPNPNVALLKIINAITNDLEAFDMAAKNASLCFAQIHGGIKGNIIPEEAWTEFSFRFYDVKIAKELWKIVNKHTQKKYPGLKIEVTDDLLNPPVINDSSAIDFILKEVKNNQLDIKEVTDLKETFSEDLAFVFEKYKGALVFVGIQDQKDLDGLHKEKYRPEDSEPLGLLRFWLSLLIPV